MSCSKHRCRSFQNPFLCDAAVVASYLKECLKNLSQTNAIASRKSLLKEVARKIDFFLKESCDVMTHLSGIANSGDKIIN